MADRLSQLQDTVNTVTDHFCNAIGVLQQNSYPSKFPNFDRAIIPIEQKPILEDHSLLFAQLISRCAKDIDTLIESLPNEDSSTELQFQSLSKLEIENKDLSDQLSQLVEEGEEVLGKIQLALDDIAQAQLSNPYQEQNHYGPRHILAKKLKALFELEDLINKYEVSSSSSSSSSDENSSGDSSTTSEDS